MYNLDYMYAYMCVYAYQQIEAKSRVSPTALSDALALLHEVCEYCVYKNVCLHVCLYTLTVPLLRIHAHFLFAKCNDYSCIRLFICLYIHMNQAFAMAQQKLKIEASSHNNNKSSNTKKTNYSYNFIPTSPQPTTPSSTTSSTTSLVDNKRTYSNANPIKLSYLYDCILLCNPHFSYKSLNVDNLTKFIKLFSEDFKLIFLPDLPTVSFVCRIKPPPPFSVTTTANTITAAVASSSITTPLYGINSISSPSTTTNSTRENETKSGVKGQGKAIGTPVKGQGIFTKQALGMLLYTTLYTTLAYTTRH